LAIGFFAFLAFSFSGAATFVSLAIYQYRKGAAFTVKDGWRSRTEYPATFWWGIVSTALMAAMSASPGVFALLDNLGLLSP